MSPKITQPHCGKSKDKEHLMKANPIYRRITAMLVLVVLGMLAATTAAF
ncbi:MAG: hypothetical protein HY782_25710, partial [Chloroflexi bacterium]|nr:hypothetical protein [Chloroflexota bacterium]